jgi:hypothetical protein
MLSISLFSMACLVAVGAQASDTKPLFRQAGLDVQSVVVGTSLLAHTDAKGEIVVRRLEDGKEFYRSDLAAKEKEATHAEVRLQPLVWSRGDQLLLVMVSYGGNQDAKTAWQALRGRGRVVALSPKDRAVHSPKTEVVPRAFAGDRIIGEDGPGRSNVIVVDPLTGRSQVLGSAIEIGDVPWQWAYDPDRKCSRIGVDAVQVADDETTIALRVIWVPGFHDDVPQSRVVLGRLGAEDLAVIERVRDAHNHSLDPFGRKVAILRFAVAGEYGGGRYWNADDAKLVIHTIGGTDVELHHWRGSETGARRPVSRTAIHWDTSGRWVACCWYPTKEGTFEFIDWQDLKSPKPWHIVDTGTGKLCEARIPGRIVRFEPKGDNLEVTAFTYDRDSGDASLVTYRIPRPR